VAPAHVSRLDARPSGIRIVHPSLLALAFLLARLHSDPLLHTVFLAEPDLLVLVRLDTRLLALLNLHALVDPHLLPGGLLSRGAQWHSDQGRHGHRRLHESPVSHW